MDINQITEELERQLLSYVYILEYRFRYFDGLSQSIEHFFPTYGSKELVGYLKEKRFIYEKQINPTTRQWCLTSKGRERIKVIMAGGVFDILHVGHLETLEAARALGDVLIVIIARDGTVRKLKKRQAITPEELRLRLIQSLKSVDIAVLGHLDNFVTVIEEFRPDIVALGYDQERFGVQLAQQLTERKLNQIEVQRLTIQVSNIKSSKIVQLIQDLGM
ncbi:MAG: adenylyltransferase/cytidyltransferase family protein [Promethearchaeota archaeon]